MTCSANGTFDLCTIPPVMLCRTPSCAYNWKDVERQKYDYNYCTTCGKNEYWASRGALGEINRDYWDQLNYMSEMHMTAANVNFTADDFTRIHYKGVDTQLDETRIDGIQTSRWRTQHSQSTKNAMKSKMIPHQDSGHAPGPTEASKKSAAIEEKLSSAALNRRFGRLCRKDQATRS